MSSKIEITNIADWGFEFNTNPIIAGPCSAESQEQIIKIAEGMKGAKPDIFRAGIWKPRTRPGTFEGIGKEGLGWLQAAREILEIPVTVEVANAKHVEEALEAGIEILWIGARTTVNPFSVQEICDALQGVDIPVLVKNPINPDLALWLGAMERLNKVGITKLGAIHRGFSSTIKTKFRNNPEWGYALRLKEELPELPIICDPSHICGNREMIQEISQKALNLGLDGLMIETHHDPDNAWSDAKQQITPDALHELMNNLVIRESVEARPELQSDIERLRQNVDHVDEQIIELLSQRFDYIKSIGDYKRENNLAVFQKDRWEKVTKGRVDMGKTKGLSEKFMMAFLDAIHEEAVKLQEDRIKLDTKDKVKV